VYYINLDHRPDRKEEITSQINKIGLLSKTTRIPGVYEKGRGHLGCSKSHIIAMEHFVNSNYKNCIIFEDDFKFIDNTEIVKKQFYQLFSSGIDYDVVLLAIGQSTSDYKNSFLKKSICTTTTSGYLVNKKFAIRLLQNFKEGVRLLESAYNRGSKIDSTQDYVYAIDQYWCKLQSSSNFYIFEPVLGKQSGSKSDIMV
jgi:GR25 family glycosyltransferase involved in LPS biosynthesis